MRQNEKGPGPGGTALEPGSRVRGRTDNNNSATESGRLSVRSDVASGLGRAAERAAEEAVVALGGLAGAKGEDRVALFETTARLLGADVACGLLELADVVDDLQNAAVANGMAHEAGADVVQALL